MTEQVVDNPDVENAEPTFKDEVQKVIFNELSAKIKERNALVGTANAASGDRLELREQLTEEGTDPEIVAARQARDDAIERLAALVDPKVDQIVSQASEGISEVTDKIKEIDGTIKPGVSYYKKMYGEEAAEFLPKQARSRSVRIGSGGGGRRVRGFKVEVTANDQTEGFDNFATAAKWLDIETSVLQDAFFEAAGNPKQVKDAPDQVEFTATFKSVDEDENEVEVNAEVLAYREEPTEEVAEDAAESDDSEEAAV